MLSQRHKLSRGSAISGTILANGRKIEQDDFGKFAAFVQQDDVLMATFTPEELFKFAAKLRTNESPANIRIIVENVIRRLRLQQCRKTVVGGFFLKGLSGGERKRTSIGYELITNPKLLLLDEPTSGLDSHTALQIVKLLKHEAKKGMNIVCTIHQPSSEIFREFNRIMVLSDGYTIYNSNQKNLPGYLYEAGLPLPKFTNPCDFLIKCAIDPQMINPSVRVESLDAKQRDQYKSEYALIPQRKNQIMRMTLIGEQRSSTFWLQFRLIFHRTLIYIIRNPRGLIALLGLSTFMAFLISSIYHDIGSKELDFLEGKSTMMSWIGLTFFCAVDQFISMSFS